jgi:hypothetical protein
LTLLHPDLGHFRIGFSIGSKKTWMVSEAANNDQMKLSILGSLKNSKNKKTPPKLPSGPTIKTLYHPISGFSDGRIPQFGHFGHGFFSQRNCPSRECS